VHRAVKTDEDGTGSNATKVSTSGLAGGRATVENLDAVVEIVGDENLLAVGVVGAVEGQAQLLQVVALAAELAQQVPVLGAARVLDMLETLVVVKCRFRLTSGTPT